MTATTEILEEYAFAAEGMGSTAASAALRRVSSLARFSPTRRAMEAISTLADMSGRIEAVLAAGDRAMADGKRGEAVDHLDEAMGLMDEMARISLAEPEPGSPDRMLRGALG
jgi:hypothetical protein